MDALADGRDFNDYFAGTHYDAMVLDLNLPLEDGLSILRRLRAPAKRVPVLMLTARDAGTTSSRARRGRGRLPAQTLCLHRTRSAAALA